MRRKGVSAHVFYSLVPTLYPFDLPFYMIRGHHSNFYIISRGNPIIPHAESGFQLGGKDLVLRRKPVSREGDVE